MINHSTTILRISSSGWLGIILGTKLYVNYAKKPFDTAYSETVGELQAVIKPIDKKFAMSPPSKKRTFDFHDRNYFLIDGFV